MILVANHARCVRGCARECGVVDCVCSNVALVQLAHNSMLGNSAASSVMLVPLAGVATSGLTLVSGLMATESLTAWNQPAAGSKIFFFQNSVIIFFTYRCLSLLEVCWSLLPVCPLL